jgi:DNA-binding winged helix-turn-helix (wHTH) protein/TolB-like protein/Flp pilus assembly protein TadD
MNQRALHYYEFGPFRLNATERLLQRGSDLVPLTPKVFDTLLVLVENSGHVLEKTELMQQLWPDSFVEESSLTQNISLLRRALTEPGAEENYIETIPKRGYRFVGSVNERSEVTNGNGNHKPREIIREGPIADNGVENISLNEVPVVHRPNSTTRIYLALSAFVLVVSLFALGYWYRQRNAGDGYAPRSVAVLPFKTIGTNGEDDLLGLGMAEAMILKMSRLDQLTVLPTSSVFRFTNRDRDPVAIGKQLGVESVLDGTVQRDGDWVRVTAQLIRLRDGKTVWSGKFDERYSSIFTLQDSISDQLSYSIRPQVTQGEKKRTHSTENTQAYQAYLTGLYFWNRRTRENLPKAITYLEQAVAQDPNFAEARAILADCYYLTLTDEYVTKSPDEALTQARQSVAKALELDDTLAEAHTVKAGIKLLERNYDEAGQEFRRALELNPNYSVAHVRYAYYLFSALKLDEALSHMRRAQQLDPVSSVTNGALAGMLYNVRDFDASISYSKRALELEPGSLSARLNLGEAYIQKRMFNEAHESFDKVREGSPDYYYWEKAFAYAFAGRREDAERMLVEVEKHSPQGLRMHYNYALVYGALGEKDKAFTELNLVNAGRYLLASVKYDPQFDPLRGDPRFKEFMKEHGIE